MATPDRPAAPSDIPLVAREAELETLLRLWHSSRLVTLCGQSGVGKSVLARAAAARLVAGDGADVVYLDARHAATRLAALRLLAGARRRLQRAGPVGAPTGDSPSRPTTSSPRAPFYVLLDDLPTIARDVAPGVLQWLVEHPEAHLLIISQRPLEVLGEQCLPLRPLPTAPGDTPAGAAALFRQVGGEAAEALFAALPALAQELVEALDGLPAAIEAAAALLETLPASEVARLARADPLSLPLRGQTLRAVVGATWQALRQEARDYLQANCYWPVTFSDEAGAQLFGRRETAPVTSELLRLGLLKITAERPQLRYTVSPLIRHLVRERGYGPPLRAQERMAFYLLNVSQQAAEEDGPWLVAADDLAAMCWAWRWLAGQGDGRAVVRFALALAGLLRRHLGEAAEALELLQSALTWAQTVGDPETISLESQLAATESRLGRLEAAEARLRTLLATPGLTVHTRAVSLLRLADVLGSRGQHAAAVEARREAIDDLRAGAENGAPCAERALAWALLGLAEDQRRLGEVEAARKALGESGAPTALLRTPYGRAAHLAALALQHAERGEREEALWHARESHRLAEAAGDGPGQAWALQTQARTLGREEPARGLALIEAAALLWRRHGLPATLATALLDTAELARRAALPPERGLQAAREALQLAQHHGYYSVEAASLLTLAEWYTDLGRVEQAEEYGRLAHQACQRTDDAAVLRRCQPWTGVAPAVPEAPGVGAVPSASQPSAPPVPSRAPGDPPLLIRLLGPLRVEGATGVLPHDRLRPKEQRVLACLALEVGQVVPRDQLLELFWPHAKLAAAERSLRTVVSNLRGAMRSLLGSEKAPLIRARLDGYCLEATTCAVDVSQFTAAVQEARAAATSRVPTEHELAAWQRAVDLYQGDLLIALRYDDWCLAARERLRDDLLDGLYRLARGALASNSVEQARDLAARMVELEPTEERAYRLLMRCYALLGRPAEAIRQFERCRAALYKELGGRPAPATVALLQSIRTRGAASPEEIG